MKLFSLSAWFLHIWLELYPLGRHLLVSEIRMFVNIFQSQAPLILVGKTSSIIITSRYQSGGIAEKITANATPFHKFRDLKFLPERNAAFDPNDMWSEVSAKLSKALQAHVQDALLDSREDGLMSDRKNYPLSMLAIHAGPRLRLLLITFQLLEMEARGTP
jgi:hypothetical protein